MQVNKSTNKEETSQKWKLIAMCCNNTYTKAGWSSDCAFPKHSFLRLHCIEIEFSGIASWIFRSLMQLLLRSRKPVQINACRRTMKDRGLAYCLAQTCQQNAAPSSFGLQSPEKITILSDPKFAVIRICWDLSAIFTMNLTISKWFLMR